MIAPFYQAGFISMLLVSIFISFFFLVGGANTSIATFTVNNETPLFRTISVPTGSRVESFRDAVRSRDGRCVVSGKVASNAFRNIWTGFEAAHVFPLAYEGHWNANDYGRWIAVPPLDQNSGTINSVQNGLLLRSDLHQLFACYHFSINPNV
jgi:hypothetical protein